MSRLKIVSYNIHQCVGMDGRRDPRRVAAVLAEIDADVVVPAGGQHRARACPAIRCRWNSWRRRSGYTRWAARPSCGGDSHYGNALLTRRPILDVRRIDLTVYRREPRGAVDVDLDGGPAPVRVLATHLGLLPGERRGQVRRLLDILSEGAYKPTVLCGDMNEWFAVGRPLRWLHARFGRTRGLPTFPAAYPVFALDRVWVDPPGAIRALTVHGSPAARAASDHLPHRGGNRGHPSLRMRSLALALLLAASLAPSTAAHAADTDSDPWFGHDKLLHFEATSALALVGYAGASLATDDRPTRVTMSPCPPVRRWHRQRAVGRNGPGGRLVARPHLGPRRRGKRGAARHRHRLDRAWRNSLGRERHRPHALKASDSPLRIALTRKRGS